MNLRLFIAVFGVLVFAMPAKAENAVADATAANTGAPMEIPQELLDLAAENEHIIIDYYSDTYGAIEPAAGGGEIDTDGAVDSSVPHEEPLDASAQ